MEPVAKIKICKKMTTKQTPLFKTLIAQIEQLNPQLISKQRKEVLQEVSNFVQAKISSNQPINLNFICTHNSRRSHLSQIWAQAMACYFKIDNVFCYSGGTEATAVFPKVIESLEHSGFQIETLTSGGNPIYSVKYAPSAHPIIGYSKQWHSAFNPKANFLAVLTCSEADKGCPLIIGAEQRIALPFEDPKLFDNTPQQTDKYLERSLQIATELFYVFSQIN